MVTFESNILTIGTNRLIPRFSRCIWWLMAVFDRSGILALLQEQEHAPAPEWDSAGALVILKHQVSVIFGDFGNNRRAISTKYFIICWAPVWTGASVKVEAPAPVYNRSFCSRLEQELGNCSYSCFCSCSNRIPAQEHRSSGTPVDHCSRVLIIWIQNLIFFRGAQLGSKRWTMCRSLSYTKVTLFVLKIHPSKN